MTTMFVLFVIACYLFGFITTLAIGAWIFWEVESTLNNKDERFWITPKMEDLLILSFAALFLWWLFVLPAIGLLVLQWTVKTKIELTKKETEALHLAKLLLDKEREDLDKLHAGVTQRSNELSLAVKQDRR